MNAQEILNKLNKPIKKYSKKETWKYVKQFYEQVGEDLRTWRACIRININDFK